MTSLVTLGKNTIKHWWSHKPQQTGAALSYFAIFSLVPLLGLISMIGSALLEKKSFDAELFNQLGGIIGANSAEFLQSSVQNIKPLQLGPLAAPIAIIVLIIGALGILTQLQGALNMYWDIPKRKTKRSWKNFLLARLAPLSIVPILAVLLIVSLLFGTIIDYIPELIGRSITIDPLLAIAKEGIPFLLSIFMFAYLYRYIPSVRIPWKEALLGAVVTSVLFVLGKNLIDFYLSNFAGTAKFGAAGTLVAIMVWIFISVQIFLLGASLARVYGKALEQK